MTLPEYFFCKSKASSYELSIPVPPAIKIILKFLYSFSKMELTQFSIYFSSFHEGIKIENLYLINNHNLDFSLFKIIQYMI